MLLNALSIYLFLALIVSIFLAMFLFTNSTSTQAKVLGILIVAVVIYTFGYLMELHSTHLEEALFWSRFQYIALPYINALWLTIGINYISRKKKISKKLLAMIYAIPLATFVIRMTNPYHYLYYSKVRLIEKMGIQVINTDKGTWYLVQSSYILLTTMAIIVIFYMLFHQSTQQDRQMFRTLFIASTIPLCMLMIQIIDPYNLSLDYTVFLMPISVVLISRAIIHNDFLEIKSLARATIFTASHTAMLILNRQERIIDYNERAVKFFQEIGIVLRTVGILELCENCLEIKEIFDHIDVANHTFYDKGSEKYWEINIRNIEQKNGQSIGRVLIIQDTTEKTKAQKKLELMSKTDVLSTLYNRRELDGIGCKWVSEQQDEAKMALLIIDIDCFKKVNDTFGHLVGDEVIHKIGVQLKQSFRDSDIVARYGGDEFVVLLKNSSIEEAHERADKIRLIIERIAFVCEECDYAITLSIGVAALERGDSFEDLISRADDALYYAKDHGRNQVHCNSRIKNDI